jgi:hypothetical protein
MDLQTVLNKAITQAWIQQRQADPSPATAKGTAAPAHAYNRYKPRESEQGTPPGVQNDAYTMMRNEGGA